MIILALASLFTSVMAVPEVQTNLLIYKYEAGLPKLTLPSIAVKAGSTFSLRCVVMHKGSLLHDPIVWFKQIDDAKYAGITGDLLHFVKIAESDAGEYRCVSFDHMLVRFVYMTVFRDELVFEKKGTHDWKYTTDVHRPEAYAYVRGSGQNDLWDQMNVSAGQPAAGPGMEHFDDNAKDEKDKATVEDPAPSLGIVAVIIICAVISAYACVRKMVSDRICNWWRGHELTVEEPHELEQLRRPDTPPEEGFDVDVIDRDPPPSYDSIFNSKYELPPDHFKAVSVSIQTLYRLGISPPRYPSTVSVAAKGSSNEQLSLEDCERSVSLPNPSVRFSLSFEAQGSDIDGNYAGIASNSSVTGRRRIL